MSDEDWFEEIKRFRDEFNLTQAELARFLGVNQKTISRWERGVDQPNQDIRERITALIAGDGNERLPLAFEAVRSSPIPLAIVDGEGTVVAASPSFRACCLGNRSEAPSARGGEGTAPGHLPTVAVIEDDEAILKAAQAVLKRWGALTVGAVDGEAALRTFDAERPKLDAAIIDFVLPGKLDGVDTAMALRERYPDLPVILITGESNPDNMRKIAGSDLPLVNKPVDPEKILMILSSLLNG